MRTDLPDYVAGKSMAQANHAGTRFMAYNSITPDPLVTEWLNEADGFGTCIVLGASYRQMLNAVKQAEMVGLIHGLVEDDTYPIRDGHLIQTLRVTTCGYIFGRKEQCHPIVGGFSLFTESKG